jgi:hypothetical protein
MQILPGTSQYPLTSGPISFLYGRSHDSLRDPEVIDLLRRLVLINLKYKVSDTGNQSICKHVTRRNFRTGEDLIKYN